MKNMLSDELRGTLRKTSIIAVLVIDDPSDAVYVGNALLRGGINTIELALRTPASLDALDRIRKECPEIYAGVGTLLNAEQVRTVKAKGAPFGVSPGLNLSVVAAAREADLPFAPGIMTPSELESAYENGCRVVKLFPSEASGGVSFIKDLNGPYGHLGIEYIPLGGVSPSNLEKYLEEPTVIAVGGSWLAPRKLIQAKDWDQISRNCEEARKVTLKVRG